MFPAYLGRALPQDSNSLNLRALRGNCFSNIQIYSEFQYLNDEQTEL
jgi:hypothetical protein